jgi:thymidylate synthase (FAD)
MEVKLIDWLGSDSRVVDSARVSFSKEASNYTKEQNEKLIKYLATHGHFTPFTHVMITMREKVPIFVARQRFKHMVGFSYNEVSRRYVDDTPEFFIPDEWRKRAENKKQGSSDEIVVDKWISLDYQNLLDHALDTYKHMLMDGVAPEQARMVLPQSMLTEYYVTGSLAAWARAYKLRSDPHAQKEIQDLVVKWHEIISNIQDIKYSWSALTE